MDGCRDNRVYLPLPADTQNDGGCLLARVYEASMASLIDRLLRISFQEVYFRLHVSVGWLCSHVAVSIQVRIHALRASRKERRWVVTRYAIPHHPCII